MIDSAPGVRELYRATLKVLTAREPVGPLREVLAVLRELANAERVFLELYGDTSAGERRWTISLGCTPEEEAAISAVTSRGIAAAAIASGETLHTPLALLDARFAAADSVQRQRLEAVLCVPLSGSVPGVLYLEAKRAAGPFSETLVALAEETAQFLCAALERLTPGSAPDTEDPTAAVRRQLRLEAIAGRSEALARVFEQVQLAAPLDVTVLLTGASGTGKTQLAQAIHDNSRRRGGPFVELNCAAIPEGLIESELFGTMPSAFPGARRTVGKVEAADGGTLFLDEIADIPISAQGKLLQLLQSRKYYPLASPKPASANIRLIAATNADLEQRVADRQFREDLFYRLNVFTIRIPSLAERRADLGPIIDQLLTRLADEHGLPRLRASVGFFAACEAAQWPGNVRQLRHALEAALIRASAEHAEVLEPRHLTSASAAPGGEPDVSSFHEATRQFQLELLRRELEAAEWNVSEVARRLSLSRQHLHNLIRAFGLSRAPRPHRS